MQVTRWSASVIRWVGVCVSRHLQQGLAWDIQMGLVCNDSYTTKELKIKAILYALLCST